MKPCPRTRAEIEELCEGRRVHLVDVNSQSVEPAGWLATRTGTGQGRMGDLVGALHPDDRKAYFDGFIATLEDPEHLAVVDYRITAADGWTEQRVIYANLLDHPDVRAVLVAVEHLGAEPAVVASAGPSAGEYDATPWAVISIGPDAVTRSVEGNVQALCGRNAEELGGGYFMHVVHPDSHTAVLEMMVHLLGNPGSTRHTRDRLVHPDGTEVWVEASLISRLQPDGGGDILLVVVDISERRAAEDALRASHDALAASHEEFRLLAEKVGVAVFRADAQGRIVFRNACWDALFPGATELDVLMDLVHPDERGAVEAELNRQLIVEGGSTWEAQFLAADGGTVLRVSGSAIGDAGSPERTYIGSLTDVTATVRLQEQATLDSLTGLHNRLALEQHLDGALRVDPAGTAVVFVDLDGFKAVNDTHGHRVGDLVLVEVARRLRSAVRSGDLVARYGGDEFVVVCRDDGSAGSALDALQRRIADVLGTAITWDGGSWTPAASVGAAVGSMDSDVVELIERADHDMFAAKRRRTGGARSGAR